MAFFPVIKPTDPAQVFRQAETFYNAVGQLQRATPQQITYFAIPMVVLQAFACELFLKCILYMEKEHTAPVRKHLLADLFEAISPQMQARLRELWDAATVKAKAAFDAVDREEGTALPRDLDSCLRAGSDAFRLIRYMYEGVPEGVECHYRLSDLPTVLRTAILEAKPEWTPASAPQRSLFTDVEVQYLKAMHKTGLWGTSQDMVAILLVREGIRNAVERGLIPLIEQPDRK